MCREKDNSYASARSIMCGGSISSMQWQQLRYVWGGQTMQKIMARSQKCATGGNATHSYGLPAMQEDWWRKQMVDGMGVVVVVSVNMSINN